MNRRFAEAVAGDCWTRRHRSSSRTTISRWSPSELRKLKPAARTAIFWHIPWPDPDRLRMCPWRREMLEGLLANNLVAFQLERDRRNFLAAVREELGLESRRRHASARRPRSRTSSPCRSAWTSIASARPRAIRGCWWRRIVCAASLRIAAPIVGVGVDRLDYTKGIPERLDAIDRLLTETPASRRDCCSCRSACRRDRSSTSYAAIEREIDERVAAINARHGRGPADGPIRYTTRAR